MAAYDYDWVYSKEGSTISKLEHVERLSNTAKIMTDLLDQEPLHSSHTQPSPDAGGSANKTHEAVINTGTPSTGLPRWPTPTAEAWASTQEKIAMRALTTLYWLHGKVQHKLQQHDRRYRAACTELKHQLAVLLNKLLRGHLADPSLDMTKIIACGMTSVPHMLESLQTASPPWTDFAVGFLQRLATDKHILAKLGTFRSNYGTGASADSQNTLALWRTLCELSYFELFACGGCCAVLMYISVITDCMHSYIIRASCECSSCQAAKH